MKLHVVDILIICAYLIVIVLIGLFLKKKAAKNMDSYFLGGKSLPFFICSDFQMLRVCLILPEPC